MGADTVMGIDAAKAWRRDCAHLFLVTSTPEAAEAAKKVLEETDILVGVCPPRVVPVLDWIAGDIGNKSFAFKATSTAHAAMGGIDMTQNFAKLLMEAEERPVVG